MAEATAVLGFLQVGFSVANVLTTYITDVKDAKDDVKSLAAELDSTLRHRDELDKLADSNKHLKGWNENGEKLVDNCRLETARSIKQLVNLIGKSGNQVDINNKTTLKREDIDLGAFQKATWPFYKDRVNVVKRELQATKINILLAWNVYKAAVGTPEERAAAKRDLAWLARGRDDTMRQLQKAQQQRGGPVRRHKKQHRKGRRRRSASQGHDALPNGIIDEEDSEPESDRETFQQMLREEIEQEIKAQMALEAEAAAAKQAEHNRLKNEAVQEYQQTLKTAFAEQKREADEIAQRLRSDFEGVPKQQIDQHILTHVHSKAKNADVRQLIDQMKHLLGGSIETDLLADNTDPLISDIGKAKSYNHSLPARAHVQLPPALMKQEAHPDCARTLAIAIKLSDTEPVVDRMHVSITDLIEYLKHEERASRKSSDGNTQTMKIWARLPVACRELARHWLRHNTYQEASWSLIYARENRIKSSRRTRVIYRLLGDRGPEETMLSVLLIYRQSRGIDDVVQQQQQQQPPESGNTAHLPSQQGLSSLHAMNSARPRGLLPMQSADGPHAIGGALNAGGTDHLAGISKAGRRPDQAPEHIPSSYPSAGNAGLDAAPGLSLPEFHPNASNLGASSGQMPNMPAPVQPLQPNAVHVNPFGYPSPPPGLPVPTYRPAYQDYGTYLPSAYNRPARYRSGRSARHQPRFYPPDVQPADPFASPLRFDTYDTDVSSWSPPSVDASHQPYERAAGSTRHSANPTSSSRGYNAYPGNTSKRFGLERASSRRKTESVQRGGADHVDPSRFQNPFLPMSSGRMPADGNPDSFDMPQREPRIAFASPSRSGRNDSRVDTDSRLRKGPAGSMDDHRPNTERRFQLLRSRDEIVASLDADAQASRKQQKQKQTDDAVSSQLLLEYGVSDGTTSSAPKPRESSIPSPEISEWETE